jgi:hypothetical protein
VEGEESGTTWRVNEGLLEMEIQDWRAGQLVELLAQQIRKYSRKEAASASDFKAVHRSARMCYELLLDKRLTMVDSADAQILYDLPLDDKTEWLNRILNKVRLGLRNTGDISIVAADHFAKAVDVVMKD